MRKTWKRNGRGNSNLKGHVRGEWTRRFILYTVYDNKTDLPVIVDGDAPATAKAMDMRLNSFYATVAKQGTPNAPKRWKIYRRFMDEIK